MATKKKDAALKFLNTICGEHDIDFRENSITQSYDFLIDTGTEKIIIKIGEKRWDDSDSESIVDFLESKEEKIHKALSTKESEILSMK
ncbi:MAG TPA: hypothetical protein DHV36_00060 [Desulfobacteraceae bacterium]|nr:hypothetical protein [Desulfobacteraceae bacterium]